MKRNHKNTSPPTRATTAPTTIIVMVVVLESLDDEAVCEGSGVVWIAVAGRKEFVVMLKAGSVVVGIAVAGAGSRVVVGVDRLGDPPSEKKKAVEVKGDRPQPRRTAAPPSNENFPVSGFRSGLFTLAHTFGFQNSVLAYQHAAPGSQSLEGQDPHGYMVVTGRLSVLEQYTTAGDR